MIIIVGLGNPGKKFENTRHNVGFEVLDFFAKKNNLPDFELVKKYDALVSEKDEIMLAKPQTFMNESGISVASLLKNANNPALVVIHDDIDLPVGKLKIVKERGSAGHKGVESIIQHVGNDNMVRFRLGIASIQIENQKAKEVVLKKFTKEEQKMINSIIGKSAEALNYFIDNGIEKTMNEYNR